MKQINIALIGTGIIAHEHAARYRDIEGVKVIAACDINEAKLNAFCDKWDIPHRYTDYRELLKRDDITAVDVNLHNNLHAPVSIAVMAQGIHCYCEKPMAGSYIDAVAMKDAAKKYGVKLHIQLGKIYNTSVACAKKLVDAGRLGKVYHARSNGYRRRGRPFVEGYGEKEFNSAHWAGHGALYDMGVYHISQLLYLLGDVEVDRVSGSVYQEIEMDAKRRAEAGFNVEELGVGFVMFKGGFTMDIIESWAIHGAEFPGSSIHGSDGGLEIYDEDVKFFSEMEGYPAATTFDIRGEQYRRRKLDSDAWIMQNSVTHWVAMLRDECKAIDTPGIALQTMLVSEGIFLSHKLGREVTVDEIVSLSESNAIVKQDTPFGEIRYN